MKPAFILEKLLQFKSPVLWVDCDATIRKQPIFFSGLTADIAAKKMPAHRERTWHVGTLWVNYTPAAIAFMEKWIANTGHISDESALNETWKKHSEEISIVDMPSSYFVIEPKNKNIPLDTVIMHRISDWPTKKREMPIAAARVKRGEF